MIYNFKDQNIPTNLAGDCINKLNSSFWQLGFISDNPGIDDINNDSYYVTKSKGSTDHKIFKNKVKVKLINGRVVEKHIIHWVKTDGYFCISNDEFWDQFTD
ncbi:hypothetical protein CPAV1605_992 [seawater metagenome]|uniref:Uncharacterized protein n=1 Tax=seawater metagenome TaxID=1561972 RepID=A0A5E8CJP8_9ZZZZ